MKIFLALVITILAYLLAAENVLGGSPITNCKSAVTKLIEDSTTKCKTITQNGPVLCKIGAAFIQPIALEYCNAEQRNRRAYDDITEQLSHVILRGEMLVASRVKSTIENSISSRQSCLKSFHSKILNTNICVDEALQIGLSSGELLYFTGRAIAEPCDKKKEGKQKCLGPYGLTVCKSGKWTDYKLCDDGQDCYQRELRKASCR